MQQSKIKRRHNKKLILDNSLIDSITSSHQLSEKEKMLFLKYVGYYTKDEKKELTSLI